MLATGMSCVRGCWCGAWRLRPGIILAAWVASSSATVGVVVELYRAHLGMEEERVRESLSMDER